MITHIHEHYNGSDNKKECNFNGYLNYDKKEYFYQFYRKKKNEFVDCYRIYSDEANNTHYVSNSYFIGVDWIVQNESAIYIQPKLNKENPETDYFKMLLYALKHNDVFNNTDDLFKIKWDSPQIEITHEEDLLTPLLVIKFIKVLEIIVRKGLKKSYYRVERNLNSRIKGKVLVGKTIKENLLKNKTLNTVCSFDEFGVNGLENRLLKKTLVFIQQYLPILQKSISDNYIRNTFNFINPAFEQVSAEVSLHDVKHTKTNAFYKEYEEAIRLAKLILKRFGYNLSNVEKKEKIPTPPFWIDMSNLFELYVLGLLKDKFKNNIIYHPTYRSKELDYLLTNPPMIIDAKYKPQYNSSFVLDDVRQISGYSRMHKVYEKLEIEKDKLIDCLIIYPDQKSEQTDLSNFETIIKQDAAKSNEYVGFYKMGIKLPMIINK